MRKIMLVLMLMVPAITLGCQSMKPIKTVERVELERFMGNWYVIANIPTFVETAAYNAVESYVLNDDGTISTTFTFNKGAFDGPIKTYKPKAFVRDETSNAVWGMQFIWPFKAEYRIVYLDDAYSITVIGRTKRDYVWIMARTPSIDEVDFQRVIAFVEAQGYDRAKIQRVPQQSRCASNSR
jgi:apolipoprotein D and lipocalin family protein